MKTIALTNMSSAGLVPLTPFQQRAVVAHACSLPDCPDFLREHMTAWLSTGEWPESPEYSRWFSGHMRATFWDMLRNSLSRVNAQNTDEIRDTNLQFAFNLMVFIYERDVGPIPFASLTEELNLRAASWPSGLSDTIISFPCP